MKQPIKTSRAVGLIEKIFRALNEKYYNGELPEPIILIRDLPNAYGQVTVNQPWHRTDGIQQHELCIDAGTLSRNIDQIAATVQHELIHLFCAEHGIRDCSRGGRYHNKHFRDEATARDLKVSYDPRIGWSITEPTEALFNFVTSQDWPEIPMFRDSSGSSRRTGGGDGNGNGTDIADGSGKKTSSTRKLVCPVCGQKARVTKASAFIICGFCNEPMVEP